MREILVQEFVSLDGVMQGPGGPEEDASDGFPHGGWQRRFEMSDEQMAGLSRGILESDSYLLGRKTYDIFAAYWPLQPDTNPFATVLNSRPKYVASTTLTNPSWANTTVLNTDVVAQIRELKDGEGTRITVIGSGELLQTLIENDLADELTLFVHPLVLGMGKKLFRDGLSLKEFDLTDSKVGGDGVLALTYRLKPAA